MKNETQSGEKQKKMKLGIPFQSAMAVLLMVAMLPSINNTGCTCSHYSALVQYHVTLTSSWVLWVITNGIYKSSKLTHSHDLLADRQCFRCLTTLKKIFLR